MPRPANHRLLLAALAALVVLPASLAPAQARRDKVLARVTIHEDGSRTHTVRNDGDRILEQRTYNAASILLMKRIFQLDRQGRALSGVAFDGRSNLLFTMRYMFDKNGRLYEEQIYDKGNRVIRLLRHSYGADGKSKVQAISADDGKQTPEWFRAIMHPDQLQQAGREEVQPAPKSGKAAPSSKKKNTRSR